MKYLLDTHAWIWWHVSPQKLSKAVHTIIQEIGQNDDLLLSAISPWEFCKLLQKERIGISEHPLAWIESALDMPRLQIIPLSVNISFKSTTLSGEFHADPADQIITATAIEEGATILTSDARIREYPYVNSIW